MKCIFLLILLLVLGEHDYLHVQGEEGQPRASLGQSHSYMTRLESKDDRLARQIFSWIVQRRERLEKKLSVNLKTVDGDRSKSNQPSCTPCSACLLHKATEGIAAKNQTWIIRLCSGCAVAITSAFSENRTRRKFLNEDDDQTALNFMTLFRRCWKCTKWAVFGDPIDRRPIACGIHKEPNLVDVIHSKCCHFGCNKSSYYRNSTHQYCKVHLPTSNFQSQIRRRRCSHAEGCDRFPCFGDPTNRVLLFCMQHKRDSDVDVVNRLCEHGGCKKHPSFRLPGEKTAKFCKEHAPPEIKNTPSLPLALCVHDGCSRRRLYAVNSSAPAFCRKHKPPGCQDVRNPRCQHQGCFKYANYGPQGRKPVYCVGHKHLDHVKRSGAGRKPGRPSLKSTDSPQGPSDLSAMPTSVTVP
mmetsp:Transcript_25402/g.84028  ORF Transcript_25402/g.84028 Transcript_25402/m.84028 type:complete len:410 (-) Transcript_25402:115-1344(-)